jgi:hypothetical protein
MHVPPEFFALYDWIEANGLYMDNEDGRVGYLFPDEELKRGWTETERPGGTSIEFGASGNANVRYWFNREDNPRLPMVAFRSAKVARTRANGQLDGLQVIVLHHVKFGGGFSLLSRSERRLFETPRRT